MSDSLIDALARMSFHRLFKTKYIEIKYSDLFPFLKPDTLLQFLRKGEAEGTIVMAKEFRDWLKTRQP